MKKIDELIQSHKRLIESEAAKYAQFVPLYVVQAEAYKLARKAAETYDEKSGVKFSTYLYNSLKKLSRISTRYGGTVRIPEGKQFKIHKLNQANDALKFELGREPTMHELSVATNLSLQEVSNLMKSNKKDINVLNIADQPLFVQGEDDEWIHFVYHDMNERDRFIFEHKTGFGGKKVMSNEEIGKTLNLSPSTVANRIKIISDKIAEGMK